MHKRTLELFRMGRRPDCALPLVAAGSHSHDRLGFTLLARSPKHEPFRVLQALHNSCVREA